jgi:hypothetical protein
LLIDFLQRDHVRRGRLDHFRYPWQIEFAVDAFAVVNVVGQNAQLAGQFGMRAANNREGDKRSREKFPA